MKTTFTNMKRWMLTTISAVLFTAAFAQPQQEPGNANKGDKIEALRIAYISQQLNLTPEDAQKFWPVYNQYKSDIKVLRQNFKMAEGQQMSAEQELDFEQKKLDLKKKYKVQFEGALGKDKVNQLYNLEKQFQEKLKELRDQRQQMRGQGQRPGGRFGVPR
jgi:Spy/CpxP family protein refolding chaperone